MDFLDNSDVYKEIEKVTIFYKDYIAARNPMYFSLDLYDSSRKSLSNLTPLQMLNFVYILGYNSCVDLANKEIENLKNTEKERIVDYFLDLFAEKVYDKIKEKK